MRDNNGRFKKGHIPHNKGLKQTEWLSKEAIEKCSKTQIQYQDVALSPLSKIEGRQLPYNAYKKGTIRKRIHVHTKGKTKGKIEYDYYINIDWRGNRKPNNPFKRYVWEVANQMDLPDGYIIYIKDQNPDNIVPENLELITRAELLKRNSGKGE